MKIFKLAAAIVLLTCTTVHAAVIDFDDLTASNFNPIQSNYAGFTWDDYHYVYSDATNTGWSKGAVSGSNALFNAYGKMTTSSTSGGLFDFTGAWFNNWSGTSSITVEGYNSGSLVDSVTMTLGNGYEWLQADILGVDQISFVADSESSWWLMDDFTVNESAVPEPSLLALFALGMLGFGVSRRKASQA